MTNLRYAKAQQRCETLIAKAKEETRPLNEWCKEAGFNYPHAVAILRNHSVPFKGIREGKREKMLALAAQGLDCREIASEMGLSGPYYAYHALRKLGGKPPRLAGPGNIYQIGNRRMSRDVPRPIKMLGDLKRQMSTRDMQEKYGISRERVSQMRAYGTQEGLLEVVP